ncbi:MAG: hypothetical protein AAF547_02535 [Actinomycetota bacterium]
MGENLVIVPPSRETGRTVLERNTGISTQPRSALGSPGGWCTAGESGGRRIGKEGGSVEELRPLFESARAGADDALWELIHLFQPLIFSVATSRIKQHGGDLRSDDEYLADIRYRATVAIHDKFWTFEGDLYQFPSWIRTIVWRTAGRVLSARTRREWHHVPLGDEAGALPADSRPTNDPYQKVNSRLESELLHTCLGELTMHHPDLVDLLRLYYYENKTSEQISAIPRHRYDPSAIRKKIKRARRLLRACMERGDR